MSHDAEADLYPIDNSCFGLGFDTRQSQKSW